MLQDIASRHGLSHSDLIKELIKDEKRESNKTKERKQKFSKFLKTRFPMDCVNYILTYMDPKIIAAINKLLIIDKIERLPSILETMEKKQIIRHLNYGRLNFLKNEMTDLETYRASGLRNEFWRVTLYNAIGFKLFREDLNHVDNYDPWLKSGKVSFTANYYNMYYDHVQLTFITPRKSIRFSW
jgi:hypothetical protein